MPRRISLRRVLTSLRPDAAIRVANRAAAAAAVVAALSLLSTGCGDSGTTPEPPARELGVVLTSTDVALTVFDVDDPLVTRTIGLAADGSPVSLAVRGPYAAVPLGVAPAVAIVDVEAGTVVRTVALPEGSGATGVAFASDAMIVVANPELNTVTPIDIETGVAGADIAVGRFPQAVVRTGSHLFVLNGELENYTPAGPSTVTVLDAATLSAVGTITLSGQNASAGALGPDGRLYIVHSGSFGEAGGALSIVDPATLGEVDYVTGFGSFPGSIAVGPDGLVHVGAFGVGVIVWDPATRSFVRGPEDAVEPGGVASTSGLAFDAEGRLYALSPDCVDPAMVYRLDAAYETDVAIPVGICPFAAAFTEVEG